MPSPRSYVLAFVTWFFLTVYMLLQLDQSTESQVGFGWLLLYVLFGGSGLSLLFQQMGESWDRRLGDRRGLAMVRFSVANFLLFFAGVALIIVAVLIWKNKIA